MFQKSPASSCNWCVQFVAFVVVLFYNVFPSIRIFVIVVLFVGGRARAHMPNIIECKISMCCSIQRVRVLKWKTWPNSFRRLTLTRVGVYRCSGKMVRIMRSIMCLCHSHLSLQGTICAFRATTILQCVQLKIFAQRATWCATFKRIYKCICDVDLVEIQNEFYGIENSKANPFCVVDELQNSSKQFHLRNWSDVQKCVQCSCTKRFGSHAHGQRPACVEDWQNYGDPIHFSTRMINKWSFYGKRHAMLGYRPFVSSTFSVNTNDI